MKPPPATTCVSTPTRASTGGRGALEAARTNRPILLSIGYASCHWCHVMSHESFDDEAVAALINRNFVPIKADRQQLPDLDQVYMLATQLMNGGAGGWPLTAFLTPDGRPWTTRSRLELGEGQLQQDVQLRVPIHGAGLVQVAGDLQGGETVQQHPEDGGQLSRRSGTELPSLGITLEGVADIAAHITRVHDDMIAGKGLQFVYDQEVTSGTATLLRWSMLTPPR